MSSDHSETPKKVHKASESVNVSCYRLCKSVRDASHWRNLYSKGNRLLLVVAEELYGDGLSLSEFLPHLVLESSSRRSLKVKRCIEESSSVPHLTDKKESNVAGNVSRNHCSGRLNFILTPCINWNKGYFVIVLQRLLYFEMVFVVHWKISKSLPYTCYYAVHPPSESVLLMCSFLCIVCCWAFLSGKSFGMCVVVRVSGISRRWFVYVPREKAMLNASDANDCAYAKRFFRKKRSVSSVVAAEWPFRKGRHRTDSFQISFLSSSDLIFQQRIQS